jgi:hypothetical protein
MLALRLSQPLRRHLIMFWVLHLKLIIGCLTPQWNNTVGLTYFILDIKHVLTQKCIRYLLRRIYTAWRRLHHDYLLLAADPDTISFPSNSPNSLLRQ